MNKLKAYRKATGLSQAQLADLIGVGQGTVARIELGQRRPGFDLMLVIERVTGGEVPLASWAEAAE